MLWKVDVESVMEITVTILKNRGEDVMDYIDRQNKCGIKEGDRVRVIRSASDNENGWDCTWANAMDECIGEEFIVLKDRGESGFRLDTTEMLGVYYVFPYFVLELVTETEPIRSDIIQNTIDRDESNIISCSSCVNNHLSASDLICDTYGQCPNYKQK